MRLALLHGKLSESVATVLKLLGNLEGLRSPTAEVVAAGERKNATADLMSTAA